MKRGKAEPQKGPSATVALVGFDEGEELSLREILSCSECSSAPTCQWKNERASGVEGTLTVLRRQGVPVVLCNSDGKPEAWKKLLEVFSSLSRPPVLVVTSRLADERLWAEALNLGAYDVLARPFNAAEVVRTMCLALLSWQGRTAFASAAQSVA